MNDAKKKAEETAVNAVKAIIKIYDFTASVLVELARNIRDLTGFKIGRYNYLRHPKQDQRVLKRYLKNPQSFGEIWVKRYFSTLFSLDTDKFPFLLASLINSEMRPPALIYGVLQKLDGQDTYFCDYYFLWLNERLDEICKPTNRKEYGFDIEETLSASSEQNKLKAHISFQITPLLDINDKNLPEHVTNIVEWFKKRINKADKR